MGNRHAAIDLDWADGTYTFRLGLGEIEELERKRDCSLFELARRLSPQVMSARVSDISETLRIGLVGGGTAPGDALALTRRYVEERPLRENRIAALAIVLAALERLHGDEIEDAALTTPRQAPVRLDFASIFASAARIGIMDPMGMSLGQWAATVRAWNEAEGGASSVTPPTEDEFDAAVAAARGV